MSHKDTNKLMKRARSKYLTVELAKRLIDNNLKSTLAKSYRNTIYCNDTLLLNDNSNIVGGYCKNRWCLVCNRNRTAVLINGYGEQLNALPEAYFVTLTARTIEANELNNRLEKMSKEWLKIMKLSYKLKKEINGVRKLEITTRPGRLYHPHFHILVNGKENAEWLINQWLNRFGKYAKRQAQDARPADERSLKELFKYFTKLTVKAGERDLSGELFESTDRQGRRVLIHPHDLDIIFRAIRKKRTYQPFGNIKKVNEEVDEKEMISLPPGLDGKVWKWYEQDWISELGEFLTGHTPSSNIKQLLEGQGM